MSATSFRDNIKPLMLPIAMLLGIVLHNYIESVAFLAPWLIFIMLFITFCKIRISEFSPSPMIVELLGVQIFTSIAIYLLINPLNHILAQCVFICIFCPTATAAPVITAMLGGSISKLISFSLASNISVAVLAPLLFAWFGETETSFIDDCLTIALRVIPLIIAPLVAAFLLKKIWPAAHGYVATRQSISFYVWALSLIIVVGRSVSFVMNEPPSAIPLMIAMAAAALIVCCAQFWIGRKIGARYGDKISAGQALGQKNTVLAIWMALTYLNPLASVGPAAYIAWQNTINSMQLYHHSHIHK